MSRERRRSWVFWLVVFVFAILLNFIIWPIYLDWIRG